MNSLSDSSDDDDDVSTNRSYHQQLQRQQQRQQEQQQRQQQQQQQQQQKQQQQRPIRSINELLQKALQEAEIPGEGDEDPEILPAPVTHFDPSKIINNEQSPTVSLAVTTINEPTTGTNDDSIHMSIDSNSHSEEEDSNKKKRLIEEEEAKTSAMEFTYDILLPSENIQERCKYIPLRLSYEERKSLRLVNASIKVSDYTNNVDVAFKNKAKRYHTQLQHIVAFLSGIVAAGDYTLGQQCLSDRNLTEYQTHIQQVLEIARRYKITNPEKMRNEYGKLVYLIQDAVSSDIKPLLGISITSPIKTVYDLLQTHNCKQLLDDPLIHIATQEITSDGKSRHTIQTEIKRKENAVKQIVRKYTSTHISSDVIQHCLYSISDNNSFLNSNKQPVSDMISLLEQHFHPQRIEEGYSLCINEGLEGSRLSHSHEMQFYFVKQSLKLWETIIEDMFRLWYMAELDMLSIDSQPYELRNTGQGLQRVQPSPRVYKAMHEILAHTKKSLGDAWVGSSVIHLGDSNVPNTLVFIDKYMQVSKILRPLVRTLSNLEAAVASNEGLQRYINAYGGINKAKKDILHDFFTRGFDGSGGDNNFNAGSCIDGRLTSLWACCSALSDKPYYPLFRLTGFLSFDGEFDP